MRLRLSMFMLVTALGALPLLAADPAALMSKRFEYRTDVLLEIGAVVDETIRLDSVRFRAPRAPAGQVARTAGLHAADVALSNVADESIRVGVAIALYDDEGRLLGVASGGSGIKPLKADRQRTFRVIFDDVNAYAGQATAFQISVELRP